MDQAVDEFKFITRAALVHDLGKVCLRSAPERTEHSFLGARYLETYLTDSGTKEKFLNCVKYHHAHNLKTASLAPNDLSYIVYEADNIAAGTDRRLNESGERGFEAMSCLESVFNLMGETSKVKNNFLLRDLNVHEPVNYPVPEKHLATAGQYQKILNTISDNFKLAGPDTMEPNELLKLLEATLSYVPSSTAVGEVCDISLYDHQKITAALAVCMLHYFKGTGVSDYQAFCYGGKNADFRNQPAFLLVSGDISGIQDFIYTVPSNGALKTLRGRSFYLEVLLENIVDEILGSLGLSRCNLIYTGGGHFYLLAPNTPESTACLEQARKSVTEWFLVNYETRLYLELAWEPCSANNFMGKAADGSDTGTIFARISRKLAGGKICRYDQNQLQDLFNPHSSLNHNQNGERECAVCHTSVSGLEPYCLGEDKLVCHNCNQLVKLGSKLLEPDFALLVTELPDDETISLPGLGRELYLLPVALRDLEQVAKTKQPLRIYVKNDYMLGRSLATNLWVSDYVTRNRQGTVTDFASLAKLSGGGEGSGIKRLGVLRADVDNLGAAFVAGFYKEDLPDHNRYATLSRQAALSRQLSLFFKHYLNNICRGELTGADGKEVASFYLFKEKTDKKRKLNVVYSGGDDVFIVGAWDELIEFAVDLRRAFARFTCGKLTFSAGIGFFQPSFPVSQMASLTGVLEDNAKHNPGKDSLSLFGTDYTISDLQDKRTKHQHTYSWQEFVDQVCGEKLRFIQEHCYFNPADYKKGKLLLGKGILYRLLTLLNADDARGRFNLARLAYTLARMEPAGKSDLAVSECYKQWRTQLYLWGKKPQDRQQLVTAFNLLIYKLRETEKGAK